MKIGLHNVSFIDNGKQKERILLKEYCKEKVLQKF